MPGFYGLRSPRFRPHSQPRHFLDREGDLSVLEADRDKQRSDIAFLPRTRRRNEWIVCGMQNTHSHTRPLPKGDMRRAKSFHDPRQRVLVALKNQFTAGIRLWSVRIGL